MQKQVHGNVRLLLALYNTPYIFAGWVQYITLYCSQFIVNSLVLVKEPIGILAVGPLYISIVFITIIKLFMLLMLQSLMHTNNNYTCFLVYVSTPMRTITCSSIKHDAIVSTMAL